MKSFYEMAGILAINVIFCTLTFFLVCRIIYGLCFIKALPWSYCGDFTGIINVVVTSAFIAIGLFIGLTVWVWRQK